MRYCWLGIHRVDRKALPVIVKPKIVEWRLDFPSRSRLRSNSVATLQRRMTLMQVHL